MAYTFTLEDPIGKAIDEIAVELNKKVEGHKWKKTLETNLFDTVNSVQSINSLDWVSLGIPLRVLSEIRRTVTEKTPVEKKEKKEKKTIVIEKKLPPEVPPRKKSPRPISQENQAANVVVNPLRESQSNYPDLLPFLTTGAGEKNKAAKKDSKRKKSVAKEKMLLKSYVNIVGKDNTSSIFYSQLQGSESSDIPFTTQVSSYDEQVEIEFFDGVKTKSDNPTTTILLFSKLNTLKSLTEVNDKVQLAISHLKSIVVPIILVAYDPDYSTVMSGRLDWIRDLLEKIKPIRYFDLKSQDQLKDVINECGLVAIRNSDTNSNKVEVISKIQKCLDKKSTEISLKKSIISILPNSFSYLSHFVTKISLESNLIKFFPSELFDFEKLQELSLNGNQIEEIPNDISKFQHLIKLDLDNNNIHDLPIKALQLMPALQELKVKANPLTKLPEEFTKVKDILQHIKQLGYEAEKLKFKIFGVHLPELMENERKIDPTATIPRIVRSAINHIIKHGLYQEGIFRLAGQSVACASLKEDFDKGIISEFQDSEYAHNVTSLLKQYLRELPEPLFLFENYQLLVDFDGIPEDKIKGELMKILSQLPIDNYHLLRTIFRVMNFVSINSEINRMDTGNITKVVGPNLVYPRVPKDPFETMSDVTKLNDILTIITTNFSYFFEQDVDLFELENLTKIAIVHRIAYGHLKSVIGTAISSDTKILWSGDSRGILRASTTSDLTHIKEIDTTKKRINCLTQCNSKLWVGFADCVQIRDEITGDVIHEIDNPHIYNLNAIQNNIWVGDAGRIIVFNGSTYESEIVTANCLVLALVQVEDNVWGACGDKKIRVWSIESKELIHEFDCNQGKLNSLSYICGKVWSCSDDASISIWDVEKRELVERLENKHTSKVFGAVKVGKNVWTYSWDGINVYNAENYQYVGNVHSYHHDAIGSIQSFYDSDLEYHTVFTGSWDQSVMQWLVKKSKK